MRFIKYLILAILVILLVSFTMGNLEPVTVHLMGERLRGLTGLEYNITLPVYLLLLAGVAIGLVIGYILEWLREHRHRRDATVSAREARRLEREIDKLKKEKHKDKDEVLALLEEAR